MQGCIRIQPRRMARTTWSLGTPASSSGAALAPGGGGGVDANEDEQGQGCYDPDSWILCKSRAERVTLRVGLTWGAAGICMVRRVLPARPRCLWQAQPRSMMRQRRVHGLCQSVLEGPSPSTFCSGRQLGGAGRVRPQELGSIRASANCVTGATSPIKGKLDSDSLRPGSQGLEGP